MVLLTCSRRQYCLSDVRQADIHWGRVCIFPRNTGKIFEYIRSYRFIAFVGIYTFACFCAKVRRTTFKFEAKFILTEYVKWVKYWEAAVNHPGMVKTVINYK